MQEELIGRFYYLLATFCVQLRMSQKRGELGFDIRLA